MSRNLYYQAIANQLATADPRIADRIFDTALDEDGKPRTGTYIVIFLGNPDLEPGRLTLAQAADSDATVDFTVRSVAEGAYGAGDIASSVFAALVGFKPAIAGRACSKITHRGSDPIQWDTDAPTPLYFSDDDFRFRSYAA